MIYNIRIEKALAKKPEKYRVPKGLNKELDTTKTKLNNLQLKVKKQFETHKPITAKELRDLQAIPRMRNPMEERIRLMGKSQSP